MSTLKSDAEALRLGLIAGTTSIGEVVAWADSVILSDRSGEAPTVLDLSVSSRRPVADVVSLLSAVPGAADPRDVGRRLAIQLRTALVNQELSIIAVARAMYRLMLDGYSPDADFESMAYVADDGVDLALEGTYGTLDDVRRDVRAFLERYDDALDNSSRSAP
jgi:hypothetical protein